jgi:diguanylate cyclase (GGDEF)-like protein
VDERAVIGPTGFWPVDEPGGLLPAPPSKATSGASWPRSRPGAAVDEWPPATLQRWVAIVLAVGLLGPLGALIRLGLAPGPLTTPIFWLVLVLNFAMLAAGVVSVRRGERSFRYALGDLAVLVSVAVTSPAATILAALLARSALLLRDYVLHPDERLRALFNFGSGLLVTSLTALLVSSFDALPWNYVLGVLVASAMGELCLWGCYRLTYPVQLTSHVFRVGMLRTSIPVLVAFVLGMVLLLPVDDYVLVLVPLSAALVWKLLYELAEVRHERATWENLDEHNASLLGRSDELEIASLAAANAVRIFPVTECAITVYPNPQQFGSSGHVVRARRNADQVSVTPLPPNYRVPSAPAAPYVTATEAVGALSAASRVLGHCELSFHGHQRHTRQLSRVLSQFLSSAASTLMLARQHDSMRSYAESKAREAEQDQLTMLGNRTRLYRGGARALRAARSRGRHASLIIFDLDGFKRINDTLGHATGDEVLKVVADRIRALVGRSDIVARVGGDEFVVFAGDLARPEEALRYAEVIAAAVSHTIPLEEIQLAVETSLGIAHAEAGVGISELLKRADIALYEAKVNKDSRPQVYEPRMAQHTPEQLLLTVDLRAALDRAERAPARHAGHVSDSDVPRAGLVLHYQPQIDLRTGAVVGAEALVRWHHPIRGLLYPDAFVPLAEQSGMITAFTSQVVDDVLRDHAELRERLDVGSDAFTVSVNVSARNLLDLSLPRHIEQRLAHHGVPPEQLVIEITESANVHDWTSAERVMRVLAELGCRISIDDFGTGFSSIQSLLQRQGTIRELKVDKSFVRDLAGASPAQSSVVQAIIHMAHGTDCVVVAEGVESAEVVALLQEMGCDIGQGYWFGRPLALAAVTDWTAAWRERWTRAAPHPGQDLFGKVAPALGGDVSE